MALGVSTVKQKKNTRHIITKLGRWIVHEKFWSSISFEVKSLNVKVTGSNKYNVETTAATHKQSTEGTAMNVILQSHHV